MSITSLKDERNTLHDTGNVTQYTRADDCKYCSEFFFYSESADDVDVPVCSSCSSTENTRTSPYISGATLCDACILQPYTPDHKTLAQFVCEWVIGNGFADDEVNGELGYMALVSRVIFRCDEAGFRAFTFYDTDEEAEKAFNDFKKAGWDANYARN